MKALLRTQGGPDITTHLLNMSEVEFSISLTGSAHTDKRYLRIQHCFGRIARSTDCTNTMRSLNHLFQTWFKNWALASL